MANEKNEYFYAEMTPDERRYYLRGALVYFNSLMKADYEGSVNQATDDEITLLKNQLAIRDTEIEKLRNRLALCERKLGEMEEDLEAVGPETTRKLYKSFERVRDRIGDLAETIEKIGTRMYASSKGKKITPEEINSILDSIGIVVEEMKYNDMWKESDPVPSIAHINKPAPQKAKTAQEQPQNLFSEIDKGLFTEIATEE